MKLLLILAILPLAAIASENAAGVEAAETAAPETDPPTEAPTEAPTAAPTEPPTEPTTVLPTTTKTRVKPASEWGSYYHKNSNDFRKVFESVFSEFKASADGGLSKCRAVSHHQAWYSRYYQNIDPAKSNEYILSYFCLPSTSYEHLRVNIQNLKSGLGEYIRFEEKLSAFGIMGAGAYHDDTTKTDDESFELVQGLFSQVSKEVESECPKPSFSTDFRVQTKVENELHYWRFPISCTVTSPNDYFTDVEIFLDEENNFVGDGLLTLVGINGLASNQKYHIDRMREIAEEERRKEERARELAKLKELETSQQKGGSNIIGVGLVSGLLVAAGAFLI